MSMLSSVASAGVLCAGFVLGFAGGAAAQSSVDFTVSGTSTVRSWTCEAKGVIATASGSASTQPIAGLERGVPTATVTVPLKGFRCPNEEMTQHLNEAMQSDKFADIVFRLDKYDMAAGNGQAIGTMTIVGNTLPFTVPVTLTATPQGVALAGDTRLDMTKFGVAPPVVMLGLMKVGPQIRIQFKGTVAK